MNSFSGVSFVVVSYNSDQLLYTCFRSIEATLEHDDNVEVEILVVDNAFSTSTHQIVKAYAADSKVNLRYISSEKNGGYGAGNNIGIYHAAHDLVCIINPDAQLLCVNFREVSKLFTDNDDVIFVGGKQVSRNGLAFHFKPEYTIPLFKRFLTRRINKWGLFNHKMMFLSGSCFFLNRRLFNTLGGFDNNIFLYCEESDVSRLAMSRNLRAIFSRDIVYFHNDWSRSNSEIGEDTYINLCESINYYASKHKVRIDMWYLNYLSILSLKAWRCYIMKRFDQYEKIVNLRNIFFSKFLEMKKKNK